MILAEKNASISVWDWKTFETQNILLKVFLQSFAKAGEAAMYKV